jgi:hyperosmotically inducible periplasmic protein
MNKVNTGFYRTGACVVATFLLLLSGCNKPADTAGAPPPAVTVGIQVDDAVISAKVTSALLSNDDVKGYDIKVATRKGEVMLSGFVDNQNQIDRSAAIAQGVEGVKGIDNKLMLKEGARSIGNKIDDGVVTARVKAALLKDPAVKSLDITVVTSKGDVQLSGFVDNETQIARATDVAKQVLDVQKVTNQMSVKK